jgi:alpha-ketoglutarate-dependent 2,4-dichlorophenoxyacetate dioxygenase
MRARHSLLYSRSLTGFTGWTDEERAFFQVSAPRPLVHVHRQSGRRCLYLASHIQDIEGLNFDESQAQVSQLIDFATQRRFVYRHQWQVGDLVIWDNLATMHRARPYDDLHARRELKSVRVLETAESAPLDAC